MQTAENGNIEPKVLNAAPTTNDRFQDGECLGLPETSTEGARYDDIAI